MNTNQLRQKRAAIITQMEDHLKAANEAADEARKNESLAAWDKAEADERGISAEIARTERTEKLAKEAAAEHLSDLEARGQMPNPGGQRDDYESAFRSWACSDTLTPEQRTILTRGTATQVVGTNSLGGFLVPVGYWPMIEKSLKDYSGIAEVARIRRTAKGNTVFVPTQDDTATEAVLVAESGAFTVQDVTIGQKQLDAYTYRSLMKSSWELMQDSEFNMEQEISDTMMPRFGRAMNTSCTIGDGSSKPNGLITAATLGKTAASATAITRAEMVDLVHSVDPAYRKSKSCGFMLNDLVLAAIKKLPLGANDASPLWQPSMRDGEPDKIEGFPYWLNQAMAGVLSTGNKVMAFGDYDKYVIRLVKDLVVVRLNELFAANGQVGFYGFMRWDGELLNTAAVKFYQLA